MLNFQDANVSSLILLTPNHDYKIIFSLARFMSALTLKIIACIAMLLDHIGYVRITYPYRIMQDCISHIRISADRRLSAQKTSKIPYKAFLFALVSEIPFNLFARGNLVDLGSSINIYFTLSLSLASLPLDESGKHSKTNQDRYCYPQYWFPCSASLQSFSM